MAEFLDIVESMRSDAASLERLYSGEGTSTHSVRRNTPQYMTRLTEAVRIYEGAFKSRRGTLLFQEALTTSDFPNLFGDIIDRQLLANYLETPQVYRAFCRIATVQDFRAVKRFVVNGSEAVLAKVAEQGEYPESKLVDAKYSYQVYKYGRKIPFAWETIINDDLDALKDIPARFGKAARRTESKLVTAMYCNSTGPDSTFFSNTNKNLVNTTNGAASTNPPLSIAALQDAMSILARQLDTDGEPIHIDAVTLVVPPALEVSANNILHATQLLIDPNLALGSAQQKMFTENWMSNRVKLAVDAYIPLVATTNGLTSWFLFADPGVGRPAIEVGFLRGHEQPEVFIKVGNAMRVGGGGVDPLNGDFDTDSLQYKVRHVLGGVLQEPKSAVASNGSGS